MVSSSLDEIEQILQSPPATWHEYEKKDEPWGIVEMEMRECKNALKKYLEDPSKHQSADKELMHVAAALVNMRAYLATQHTQNKD